MRIERHRDTRAYFHERLRAAWARLGSEAPSDVEAYLVDLLASGAPETGRHATLVHRLRAAHAEPDRLGRLRALRATGDRALFAVGVEGPRLAKRGISPSYVADVGRRAYRDAGSLARVRGATLVALADGFPRWARALDEVREESELRTPQDIVRLYDRYRRTGSRLLAERLQAEGVHPVFQPHDETLH